MSFKSNPSGMSPGELAFGKRESGEPSPGPAFQKRTPQTPRHGDMALGRRAHSPLLTSEEDDVDDAGPHGAPRYSHRLVKKIRSLTDGGVARFQVGECCFMALKMGDELYVRPFGNGVRLQVNGEPITGLTRITLDDTLNADGRRLLLRRPRTENPEALNTINRLLSGRGGESHGEVSAPW